MTQIAKTVWNKDHLCSSTIHNGKRHHDRAVELVFDAASAAIKDADADASTSQMLPKAFRFMLSYKQGNE